jgi:hypothetical protein
MISHLNSCRPLLSRGSKEQNLTRGPERLIQAVLHDPGSLECFRCGQPDTRSTLCRTNTNASAYFKIR